MRIGIVNDMALAREALRRVVASSPEHAVAWLATDGLEAVEHARRDPPDLILMDLVMPGLDGVEATRRIMAENACPIVIVTSTVHGNLGKVYDAMALGALDVIDTPALGPRGEVEGGSGLLAKVATVGKLIGKPCRSLAPLPPAVPVRPAPSEFQTLVAIGCSTGGPNALAQVLSAFPDRWDASVVVIQHVDAAFALGLAQWLAERSGKRVGLAEPGAAPGAGPGLDRGHQRPPHPRRRGPLPPHSRTARPLLPPLRRHLLRQPGTPVRPARGRGGPDRNGS